MADDLLFTDALYDIGPLGRRGRVVGTSPGT
jgi:hypothetical protein